MKLKCRYVRLLRRFFRLSTCKVFLRLNLQLGAALTQQPDTKPAVKWKIYYIFIREENFLVSSKHIMAETGNKINPLNTIWPISNSHWFLMPVTCIPRAAHIHCKSRSTMIHNITWLFFILSSIIRTEETQDCIKINWEVCADLCLFSERSNSGQC